MTNSAIYGRLFFFCMLVAALVLFPPTQEGIRSAPKAETGAIIEQRGEANLVNNLLPRPEASPGGSSSREQDDDRITDLPGLTFEPSFKQYAGYLTIDEERERKIFYWYVESQNDPSTDPVVYWTNGGPGCSGFVGFGTEHGPFFISADGKLTENPFAWNKAANMLYVEQPAGVGFSYSKDRRDNTTGDKKSAEDAYKAIEQFFKRYPNLQLNDFYISSESYGGHYMPQLTLQIWKSGGIAGKNFRGMLVGNPYVDPFTNTITQIQSYYSHGLLAWPVYSKWLEECLGPRSYLAGKCQKYIDEMFKDFGDGINPYALDFPVCVEDARLGYAGLNSAQTKHGLAEGDQRKSGASATFSSQASRLLNHTSHTSTPPFLPKKDHYRPCAEAHLETYLNRADVQQAIHAELYNVKEWRACSHKLSYSDEDTAIPTIPLYEEIIATMKTLDSFHMMVVSGDDDSICSLGGTQTWIWNLGVKAQSNKMWRPWKVMNQTAGFVTKFELGNATESSFTFATVHGAGHEVPAYRPMESLQLFRNYLDGKW